MFTGLGMWELIVVLVIVLVIFGGGKLAGVGKSLGQGIREFRQGVKESPEQEDGDENPPATKSD